MGIPRNPLDEAVGGHRRLRRQRCRGGKLIDVHLIRRPVLEGLMRAHRVVKAEVPGQRRARLGPVRVRVQIDLLLFDTAPEPLNKHVVDPARPCRPC